MRPNARTSRQRNNGSLAIGSKPGDIISHNLKDDYDRKADMMAAAKAKLANFAMQGDESSDQKELRLISGLEESETTDHFGQLINIPNNQNDMIEFESFMDGIQKKLKFKED